MSCLLEQGYVVSQGALSKDLKKLGVVKVSQIDGSYYEMKSTTPVKFIHGAGNIVSVEFSFNIMVIKTLSGFANAVCAKIDDLNINGVAGTIAGDDTIFAVISENADKLKLLEQLHKNFVF